MKDNLSWHIIDYKMLIICLIYILRKIRIEKGYWKKQEMLRKRNQRKNYNE